MGIFRNNRNEVSNSTVNGPVVQAGTVGDVTTGTIVNVGSTVQGDQAVVTIAGDYVGGDSFIGDKIGGKKRDKR